MRTFRKVGDQDTPAYLLKKFAASEVENFDADPFADLRGGHEDRVAKISRDRQKFGEAAPAAPKPEWERAASATTYQRQSTREAAADMERASPESFNSNAIRRVEGGNRFDTSMRGAVSPYGLFMTAGESFMLKQEMEYLGIPTIDPALERLSEDFTSAEAGTDQHMSRRSRNAIKEAKEAKRFVQSGHAQRRSLREHKEVNARSGMILPGSNEIRRSSSGVEAVNGRFAQKLDSQLAMLAERDEVRREEVDARMKRKAQFKGIDHQTPAERHADWESQVQSQGVTRMGDTTSFIDRILENF